MRMRGRKGIGMFWSILTRLAWERRSLSVFVPRIVRVLYPLNFVQRSVAGRSFQLVVLLLTRRAQRLAIELQNDSPLICIKSLRHHQDIADSFSAVSKAKTPSHEVRICTRRVISIKNKTIN